MQVMTLAVLIGLSVAGGPVSAVTAMPQDQIVGYIRVGGDVDVFQTKTALDTLDKSQCISGIMEPQALQKATKALDRKRVVIMGRRLRYLEYLTLLGDDLQQTVALLGNYCAKDEVFVGYAISEAEKPRVKARHRSATR